MSAIVIPSSGFLWFKRAHCCIAASNWRRWLMQALRGVVLGRLIRFGKTIVVTNTTSRPATTLITPRRRGGEDLLAVSIIQWNQHRAAGVVAAGRGAVESRRQGMSRDRACRHIRNRRANRVFPAQRTLKAAGQIGCDVNERDSFVRVLLLINCPLLNRSVYLPKFVDAGVDRTWLPN